MCINKKGGVFSSYVQQVHFFSVAPSVRVRTVSLHDVWELLQYIIIDRAIFRLPFHARVAMAVELQLLLLRELQLLLQSAHSCYCRRGGMGGDATGDFHSRLNIFFPFFVRGMRGGKRESLTLRGANIAEQGVRAWWVLFPVV